MAKVKDDGAVLTVFGKRLAELTGEERTRWRQAVRLASYYRKHERNKAQQRKDTSWRKLEILEVLGWPAACSRCGYDRYIGALDFHHIDPDTKTDNVMNVLRADAIEEARKCELLCKNCHAEEHATNRTLDRTSGRPMKALHPQVAAYLRAVGVSRPGEDKQMMLREDKHLVRELVLDPKDMTGHRVVCASCLQTTCMCGRLGDGTVCEEAETKERLAAALSDTHRRIQAAERREDDRRADWVEHVEGQCPPDCIHCPVR